MRLATLLLIGLAVSGCGKAPSQSPTTPPVTLERPSAEVCERLSAWDNTKPNVYLQLTVTKLYITDTGIYEASDDTGQVTGIHNANLFLQYCTLNIVADKLTVQLPASATQTDMTPSVDGSCQWGGGEDCGNSMPLPPPQYNPNEQNQ